VKYNKKYDDPDMTWYRYTVFAQNYKTVQDQNEKEEDLVFETN